MTATNDPHIDLIPSEPVVFTDWLLDRLAESNRAIRQMRDLGCRVCFMRLSTRPGVLTELVVDRNPHRLPIGCPDVHVTWAARP